MTTHTSLLTYSYEVVPLAFEYLTVESSPLGHKLLLLDFKLRLFVFFLMFLVFLCVGVNFFLGIIGDGFSFLVLHNPSSLGMT